MSTQRKRIAIIVLDFKLSVGYGLRCHLATSDPIDELELFIRKPDISLIELISDGPPPILILGFFDKLGDHVVLLLFGYLLKVFIVPEMFQLIIPSIGYATYLNLSLLVFLVVGFLLAEWLGCLLDLFLLKLRRLFCSASLHPSPIIKIVIRQPLSSYHNSKYTASNTINWKINCQYHL